MDTELDPLLNSAINQRIETLKRNLAELHPDDREAYTAAKTDFIQSVVGDKLNRNSW